MAILLKKKKLVVKKPPVENLLRNDEPPTIERLSLADTTMKDIYSHAMVIASRCRDYNVKSDDLSMLEDGKTLRFKYNDIIYGTQTKESEISRYALSQLGTKIGVPSNYLVKCVEKGKSELAQHNVNTWLDEYKNDFFIREYENRIRGVLSSKYSVCDTPEVVQVLSNTLNMSDFNVKGHFMSEERFHLRLAQKTKMRVADEDLFAGLSIDSSDVGRSTLTVKFLVYKQVCTNGLIVSRGRTDLFKQKHIGISAEAFARGLSESIELFPSIVAKVEKSIENTRQMPLMYNFDYHSEEDLADLVESIKKDTSLQEAQVNKVINIMRSDKYEQNRWGYINALTEVAQDLTLEKRLLVEQYAGRLLVA